MVLIDGGRNAAARFATVLAVVGFCMLAATAATYDGPGPQARVERKVGEILRVLRNQGLSREERWERIGRVVDEGFDFRSMSQSVLSTSWREATPEEKRRFVEYFSQYLEETYRTKIEQYTNERVEYVRETIRGSRAVVDTVIVTNRTRIPVTYRMKLNEDGWYAYDVVIEGVSLVNNYRNTFAAIVKAEGVDGLLLDLQDKIEAYKAERDAAEGGAETGAAGGAP